MVRWMGLVVVRELDCGWIGVGKCSMLRWGVFVCFLVVVSVGVGDGDLCVGVVRASGLNEGWDEIPS
jgi:Ni/Fe-hydrogenase subunit HybB-like protein